METKNLPIHDRIKTLRKSKGWTQSELAEKISTDTRMVSLYESQKSFPSIEVLVKIAEIFDVSIDYLLIEDAPRRPLKQNGNSDLIEKLAEIDRLSDKDKESIEHIINSLIAKNKMKELVSKVG